MNRCQQIWTVSRFYVVVAFSWAKVLKSVWTFLNRCVVSFWAKAKKPCEPVYVFLEQKPWIGVNRFEPFYVFMFLSHSRGLKSLNRSEPVWTGLCFFWAKAMIRCEPVWTGLCFFLAKVMKWCKPVWTGLRFFESELWIGVKRFEPLYISTLSWHFCGLKSWNRSEPVWTGLCFF